MKLIIPIAQRVFYAVALLIAVLVLNFSMLHLAPGDIADTIAQASGGADAEVMEQIRKDYGLDQPFYIQLGRYIGNVLSFDLGYSFFYNQPVTDLILEKLPATLLLVITAQILALIVGVLLGVFSARNPNGLASYVVTFLALFGYAAPVFWTGILLLIAFSLKIPLFPVAGMIDVTVEGGFFVRALDIAHHMVLPVITLASIFLALYSRLCRASMLEVLGSDYVRTAKAKGLAERAEDAGIPLTTRSVGGMFGFFFHPGPVDDFAQAQQSDAAAFRRFFAAMLDEGVYLAPSPYEAGFVSLAHRPRDIAQTLEAAEIAFDRVARLR